MNISKNLQYTHTKKNGNVFLQRQWNVEAYRFSLADKIFWISSRLLASRHTHKQTNRGARLAPGGIINSLVKFKTVKQWCLHTPARTHAHTMQRVNFIRLASIVKIFQDDWMARLLITHIKLFCLRRTVK